MLCRDCGSKLSTRDTFCPHCGARRIVVEIDDSGAQTFSIKENKVQLSKKPKPRASLNIWVALLIIAAVVIVAYILSRPSGI